MKKIYIDENDCADLSSLLIKSEALRMVGQRLITLLCHLDYPPETLSSPIYKGLISRAIEAEEAAMKKKEEIVSKYFKSAPIPFYTINIVTGTMVIRDSFTPTVAKDMTAEVEERYQGAIHRYNFLMNREMDNIAFLIFKHFEDKDDSFLDSDIVRKRFERFEEADAQRIRFEVGTAALIFDDESVELSQTISYSWYCDTVRVIV